MMASQSGTSWTFYVPLAFQRPFIFLVLHIFFGLPGTGLGFSGLSIPLSSWWQWLEQKSTLLLLSDPNIP
jgi:hypothetical protein